MAQFMMKQHTTHADAAVCAPAACSARMEAASASENLSMDTAMCAVSFFVVLVLAVVLRLIGLISLLALVIMINVLMIIGLLVWNKQGNAKSVFARSSETA